MDELDKFLEASWSPTVDVFINISYTKILDIDTINQRFQAEAIIESKWFDPNIKSINDPIDEKKIWKPDLYVENGIKDVKEEVVYRVVPDTTKQWRSKAVQVMDYSKQNFMVCEMRKVTGVFYENLELEDFPLDVQDLTLQVASKKPGDIVHFVTMQEDKKEVVISSLLDKSMWKMHRVLLTRKKSINREYSYGSRKYPSILISAKVFRLPGFFYWNALLPFLLVSLASLAPFVNDIKNVDRRLPATCTLILTTVGTRFTIGRFMPTVSYLTSLDKYSLGTMFIITMELLYHAIFGSIFPKINPEIGYKIDFAFFCFFFFLIILKQVLFIIWATRVRIYRKRVEKMKVLKLNDELLASAHTLSEKPTVFNFGYIWKFRRSKAQNCHQEEQNEKMLSTIEELPSERI